MKIWYFVQPEKFCPAQNKFNGNIRITTTSGVVSS